MPEKALLFDSGPLINLSMNGLLYIIERLKKTFKGKFIITESVKYEIIDRPLKIPRFELGALRIQELLDSKILELPVSLGVDNATIKDELKNFSNVANNCVKANNKSISIISEAETSCLALSKILTKRNIENIIAIDERTTRILTEKPENLEKLMGDKLKMRVRIQCDLETFSNFRFIRSTELVYVAYKKDLLGLTGKKVLEASLYATKYKGAAVSFEEIDVLKKM
ncbi:MAG: hypothetical protein AABX83_01750 [Nanoarchaeota archaeon]